MLSSYEETINYLYERLPMFSRIGAAAYKADLKNTEALCAAFDHPERKFKSIHIAGTNGKGSTSHMLAAILQQAGYKVGLYTSPHLKDFRERIQVSPGRKEGTVLPLQMIDREFVVEFTAQAEPFVEVLQPSFFELTVVMAFEYFAVQQVDIAIIETGLGGRLDSTNVIVPELSIITNISLDHTALLGHSLNEIAREKAGIIKRGVPVIIGEKQPETETVFEAQAALCHAPVIWAQERIIQIDHTPALHSLNTVWRRFGSAEQISVELDLPGAYQLHNLATVLTATEVLVSKGYQLPDDTIVSALQQVKKLTGLHGRWEIIHTNPTVILDVGHNEAGIRQITAQLSLLNDETVNQVHIVLGMVKDKAITEVLKLLPPHYRYYFTQAQIQRALPATELKEQATAAGLSGEAYEEVNTALQVALQVAAPADVIVVCGSVFLVGEVNNEQLIRNNEQ